MTRCHPCFSLPSLLALVLSGTSLAGDSRFNDWYTSQYGPITHCHSLSAGADGSYVLDRYLFVSGKAGYSEGLAGLRARSKGVGLRLVQKAEQKPDDVPFFYERYHLDNQYHILNGKIVQGTVPDAAGTLSRSQGWCQGMETYLSKLDLDGTTESRKEQSPYHNISIARTIDVRGERAEDTDAEGHDSVLLNVADDTTPLVLVAHGWGRSFSRVYDPLYAFNKATDFSSEDFYPYRSSFFGLMTLGGVSASTVTLGAALTMFNPLLGGIFMGGGLAGVLTTAYLFNDYLESPLNKATAWMDQLVEERAEVREKLSVAYSQEAANKHLLTERYNVTFTDNDLRQMRGEYQQRKDSHDRKIATEHVAIAELKQKLDAAERSLLDIEEKEHELLKVETDLNSNRIAIDEIERRLRKQRESPLPYPGTSAMPEPFDMSHYTPPVSVARGNADLYTQLDKLMQQQNDLRQRYIRLRTVTDRLAPKTVMRGEIYRLENDIRNQYQVMAESEAAFEKEVGEPLKFLENYFQAQNDIARYEECREELTRKINSKARVHVWLMELVSHYQDYRRSHRVIPAESVQGNT